MSKSIANQVDTTISQIVSGTIFGYDAFDIPKEKQQALAKALSRMAKAGKIRRVLKGQYLKPKFSKFGELKVSEEQVVKALTVQNGKKVGYLTGTILYNRMGITNQVANILVIALNKLIPSKEVEGYQVKFVKRNAPIKENNIRLLQILDAFMDIKQIPGVSVNEAYILLPTLFKKLNAEDKKKLTRLAFNYPPSTRALLGLTFENLEEDYIQAKQLKDSLNPMSVYHFGIDKKLLPNQSKWNIK